MWSTPSSYRPKKQSGVLWRLLKYYFEILKEFLQNTVLNGLKYFTYNYLTIWEKLFFLGCFLAASYFSFNFAVNIMVKWQTSPVMTVMNPEASFISKEPFPAISICNMNQAQNSKVKDFKESSMDYALLQKLCFQELNYTAYASKQPRTADQEFAKFIVTNAQPCSHMVAFCEYGDIERTCTDLFREVLLDEGLCCTFNVVHPFMLYKGDYYMIRDFTTIDGQSIPLDWSPEKGYPKELPNSFYPRTARGDGMTDGLTIILNGDIDNYHCSSTNGPGFKVAFHNPIDTPHVKETGLSVALGFQTSFRVTTLKEEAVEELRSYATPKERQCYYTDEYQLHYFRHYTRRNCEMECDSHFMLNQCKCIPYHMPRLFKNSTVCSVRHFDCLSEAEKDISDAKRLECKAQCLSSCNDISYFPQAFITQLGNDGYGIRSPYFRNISTESLKENYAVLKIFFPRNYYRGNVKSPYMGLTEFLSQTGGIMSLMMGFSIISVVELCYFFIIKPIIYAWRKVFRRNRVEVQRVNDSEMQEFPHTNLRTRYPLAPPNVYSSSQLPPYSHPKFLK